MCSRNGNVIPDTSPLADVVQAVNYDLFICGSHPLGASEMLATSQASLVDAEDGAEALHGPLCHSPSAQRTAQTSVLLKVFPRLLVVACFTPGVGTRCCSINSLNAVQETYSLLLELFE